MGGWIAQCLASNHTERVRRLMLFDSAGIYEQSSWDTQLFTAYNARGSEQTHGAFVSPSSCGTGICCP